MAKSVIGALRVTLGLDSAQFETGIKRTQKSAQAVAQHMGIASRDVQGFGRASEQAARQASLAAKTMAAAFAGVSVTALAKGISDLNGVWTDFSGRVRVAIGDAGQVDGVMGRLVDVAQRTYSSFENTAEGFLQTSLSLRELGYNTQQQLDFTEALNNAIVVSGAKQQAATQVMDNLSKAMATGSLRGEELNTVLARGQRVAQAIAKEMGANTNQLRALGKEGKITSNVIFKALTKEMESLRGEADSMAATVSDGFIRVRNAVLEYIGTSRTANEITTRLANTLVWASENFGQVATAVAILAGAIGTHYVASLGKATWAMVAKSAADVRAAQTVTALAAAQTRYSGLLMSSTAISNAAAASVTRLSVAMGVAARGSMALLAALGPIAVTLGAVSAAFSVYNAIANEGDDLMLANAKAADELGISLSKASQQAVAAIREQKGIASAAATAEPKIWSFKNAVDGLSKSLWEQAKAARSARVELLNQQLAAANKRTDEALSGTWQGSRGLLGQSWGELSQGDLLAGAQSGWKGIRSGAANILSGGRTGRDAARNFDDARAVAAEIRKQIDAAMATPIGKADVPPQGSAAGDEMSDKEKRAAEAARKKAEREAEAARKKAERDAQHAADALRRFADEIARENADLVSITGEMVGTIEARRDAELNQIEVDRQVRERAIKADDDLDEVQREYLSTLNETNALARQTLVNQRAQEDLGQRTIRREQDRAALEIELLDLSADLARTAKARRAVEQRILDAQFAVERRTLEIEAASSDVETALRARARLAALPALRAGAQDRLNRQTQGPMEAYLDRLPKTADQAREALERVKVDGINSIVDGLADAAAGAQSLGDVFKRVTQQIIADLMRIQIQKAIVGALGAVTGGASLNASTAGTFAQNSGFINNLVGQSVKLGNLEHFATGGSFKVGGAPGIDKNLIAFKATRGEMVDIRRPGADGGASGQQVGSGAVQNTYAPVFNFPGVRTAREARVAGDQAAAAFRRGMQSSVRGAE